MIVTKYYVAALLALAFVAAIVFLQAKSLPGLVTHSLSIENSIAAPRIPARRPQSQPSSSDSQTVQANDGRRSPVGGR